MSNRQDDLDLPPPAYDITQEELDRKVERALEESLAKTHLQPRPEPEPAEGEWEEWDEAAFEAAAARAQAQQQTAGGSSSTTSPRPLPVPAPVRGVPDFYQATEPLRINKREKSRSAGSFSSPSSTAASSSPRSAASTRRPLVVHNVPDDPEDEPVSIPPPFAPVGPSLDGPPYEQVVMAYRADASPPPSPLTSPIAQAAELAFSLRPPSMFSDAPSSRPPSVYGAPLSRPQSSHGPAPTSRPQSVHEMSTAPPAPAPIVRDQRQSMPPPRRQTQRLGPRPLTSYTPPTNGGWNGGSSFGYDPSAAYGKPAYAPPAVRIANAAALYNSAVASQMATTATIHTPQPQRPISSQYVATAYELSQPNTQAYTSISYQQPPAALQTGGFHPAYVPSAPVPEQHPTYGAYAPYAQPSQSAPALRQSFHEQPAQQPSYTQPGAYHDPRSGTGNATHGRWASSELDFTNEMYR